MSQDNRSFQLLLLEKIAEIGERTVRMETEQLHLKSELEQVKEQDKVQNQLLAEHIAGVNTANARLTNEIEIRKDQEARAKLAQQELEDRVDKLEEPSRFLSTLKKYVLYVAAFVGAATGIIKVLEYLGK